jgi:hypothetical protein
MNNIGDNYFGDANKLMGGCFPQMQELWVYEALEDDRNGFTEQCFPAKMQAASL